MNNRSIFLDYVRNGGKPICSPQIGAGAGFDTKLAGKEWVSATTVEDTLSAVRSFDIIPLIDVDLCDLGECNPALGWKDVLVERSQDRIVRESTLETPIGNLYQSHIEQQKKGIFRNISPVKNIDDLRILEYYIDQAIDSDLSSVTRYTTSIVNTIAGIAALCIQWPTQPYELLCFPNTVNTVMLALDAPELFKKLMERILLLDEKLIAAVSAGGADFIFLGSPAAELISPAYYESYIVPYSQQVSAMAHTAGMMVYSHICSPIEPFLSMGFYNRMGIDLFETLSPPPVGNVGSLAEAMGKINPDICTRGNLGLDILLDSSPEEIETRTLEIIESTAGRKHIVAASDYLFYDVPEGNIRKMAEVVSEFNK